jgi:hypothetical protein
MAIKDHRGTTYWVLAVLYTAIVVLFLLAGREEKTKYFCVITYGFVSYILLGVILITPPVWFLLEYHVIEGGAMNENGKYHQELASRVWAAVSAFAVAIVLKK